MNDQRDTSTIQSRRNIPGSILDPAGAHSSVQAALQRQQTSSKMEPPEPNTSASIHSASNDENLSPSTSGSYPRVVPYRAALEECAMAVRKLLLHIVEAERYTPFWETSRFYQASECYPPTWETSRLYQASDYYYERILCPHLGWTRLEGFNTPSRPLCSQQDSRMDPARTATRSHGTGLSSRYRRGPVTFSADMLPPRDTTIGQQKPSHVYPVRRWPEEGSTFFAKCSSAESNCRCCSQRTHKAICSHPSFRVR